MKSRRTHPKRAVPGAKKGRPTEYTDELGLLICQARLKHPSFRETLAQEPGLPASSTIRLWLIDGKHPEFAERFNLAARAAIEDYEDEIIAIADENPKKKTVVYGPKGHKTTIISTDQGGIERNKLRIKARIWRLSTILPKKYPEKIEPEPGPGITEPLVIHKSVIDEERKRAG
jgi:hypothetical protein